MSNSLSSLPIGYILAISLAALAIISSIAIFICLRRRNNQQLVETNGGSTAVVLPRIIFVAEDEEDNCGNIGLDAAVINSYPRFPYLKDRGGDVTCAICLCEYREGEMMRMLPDCRHVFHLGCVDAWLKLNASCPVCRTSPLPTPMSTPLSELVPLSHYSNGRRQR